MTATTRSVELGIGIPVGYVGLPLSGIDSSIESATALLREVGAADLVAAADRMLPAMRVFLGELGRNGVRFCGLGRHMFDEVLVTSVLTVLVYDTGGDRENPRLVVKNLAEAAIEGGDHGDLQVVELDNRPMLFFERVRDFPVPEFAGNPTTGTTAPVYQLDAVVPSEDGSAVASIELSTVFAEYGPRFRSTVIDMARSVSLRIQSTGEGALSL
ncbi:hypothetical protein ACWDSJ_10520 [Nocardia sp. NPDC003482]